MGYPKQWSGWSSERFSDQSLLPEARSGGSITPAGGKEPTNETKKETIEGVSKNPRKAVPSNQTRKL